MTCIAAISLNGHVTMGADSAGVGDGYSLSIRADTKVFKRDNYLIGFTTSFRMGQLLRYSASLPVTNDLIDPEEFMITHFVESCRQCFKSHGFNYNDHEREEGGDFLVAFGSNLFHVQSDYQVSRQILPYVSIGCGRDAAMGSLYILHKMSITPQEMIMKALESACNNSAGVRPPYVILSNGG